MAHIICNARKLEVDVTIESKCISIAVNNHFELIQSLLQIADSAFFVSPFLYENFSTFFSDVNLKGKSIELITSCAPRGTDQLKKPLSLRSFGSLVEQNTGTWPKIGVDQSLHSKIYIFLNFRDSIVKTRIQI